MCLAARPRCTPPKRRAQPRAVVAAAAMRLPSRADAAALLHEAGVPVLCLAGLLCGAAGWPGPARAAVAVLCVQAARLAVADADLTLLSLGPAPAAAFAPSRGAVWVVGASQGLGEVLALRLAACGAALVLSSRSADRLQAVAAACLAAGAASAHVVPLDVLDPASRAAAVGALTKQLVGDGDGDGDNADGAAPPPPPASAPPAVAHLFLVAGGSQRACAALTSPDVDSALVSLNALGPYALAKAALPLLARGGRVTALTSAAALLPSPGQASYAGSKACLASLLATLRAEGAAAVTLVAPGPVATGAALGQARLLFGEGGGRKAPGAAADEAAGGGGGGGRRLPAARAAELVARAAAHGVRHAWVGQPPVLPLLVLQRLCAAAADAIVDAKGPGRVRAAAEGRDMYAASKF